MGASYPHRDRLRAVADRWLQETGRDSPLAALVAAHTEDVRRLAALDDSSIKQVFAGAGRKSFLESVETRVNSVWRKILAHGLISNDKAWIGRWWLPYASSDELRRIALGSATIPRAQRVRVTSDHLPSVYAIGRLKLQNADPSLYCDRDVTLRRSFVEHIAEIAVEVAKSEGLVSASDLRNVKRDQATTRMPDGPPILSELDHEMIRTRGDTWWTGGE